jgi:sensor histidine kinase regulating citrate/malate metabolism
VEALGAISSLFVYEIKLMRIEYTIAGTEDCPRVDVFLPILQRIRMHLMANAVECEREGERRSITVKVASQENMLRISITNTGLRGIEFDVAQCSTLGFSTKDGHAGMGLSVTNTLTESIGGTLSYEAELGWTLSIPFAH